MTHEEAFLQDIVENPDDDTPRRIFADWLLDQDDPTLVARGEFVHLQCELARTPSKSPRSQDLLKRERALLWEHGKPWGTTLERCGCVCWEYRRGFVEGVGLSIGAFLGSVHELFRVAPVRDLKLYHASGKVSALALCPLLQRLHSLDLEKNDLSDGDLIELLASPHLGNLQTLLLWNNRVGDAGVCALTRADLPHLTRLDLASNFVGDAGAIALAGSRLLGRLRLLDLTANQIGDPGGIALAQSPQTGNLSWLDLTKNPIDGAQMLLRERLAGRVGVLN